MIAADKRYTLHEASILVGKSVDTLRRMRRDHKLAALPPEIGIPNAPVRVTAQALVDAGLIGADELTAADAEHTIAIHQAEAARAADHDELLTLRAQNVSLQRELARTLEQLEQLHRHLAAALKNRAA
jgi:hypothetical protein